MNRLDWAQIALSLGVMLIGFYIALFRHPGRRVLATTRVASFGVALLGLSYFSGGFEGSAIEGPLLDRGRSVLGVGGDPGGTWGIGLAGA
jgi:hypothetical protein